MSSSLIDAAEAAVVAHFATQLAGRLGERHVVDRTRALCDEARRAVRLLLAEAPAAARADAAAPRAADARPHLADRVAARG
jgi:hypothetical protein